MIINYVTLMILAFCQNVSFTLSSRSRNRNHKTYHLFAAILSNGVWYATLGMLVVNDMSWDLFIPYTVGTVSGSVAGMSVAEKIEKLIGAET
jgi:putative flippase GtrA